MKLFEGLEVFIDLDGEEQPFIKMREQLVTLITKPPKTPHGQGSTPASAPPGSASGSQPHEGGTLAQELGPHCTHAVLRHAEQLSWMDALAFPTVKVVRPEWVIDCASSGQLLPTEGYTPLLGDSVHGMVGRTICITGFKDVERRQMAYLVEATGASFSGTLSIGQCYCLVASDSTLSSEPKAAAALMHGLPVVRKAWLLAVLQSWQEQATEPYQLFMPPAVQQQSGEAAAQHEEARHPQALPRQSAGMPPPGTLLLEAGMCCEGDVPAQPAGGAPGAAAPAMPAALQECGDGRVCNPQPLAGTCLPAAISDAPAAALEATAANAAGTPVAAAAEVDAAGPAAQGEEEQQPAGTASGSTCLPSGEGSWGTMACGEQEAESLSVQQSAGDGLLQSLLQQPLQSPLQPPLQLPVQPSLQSPVQSPMQLPVQPPVQQDCGRATSGGGCGEPLQQRCYQATSGGGCGQPLEPAESGSTTCASSGSADLEAEGDGGVQSVLQERGLNALEPLSSVGTAKRGGGGTPAARGAQEQHQLEQHPPEQEAPHQAAAVPAPAGGSHVHGGREPSSRMPAWMLSAASGSSAPYISQQMGAVAGLVEGLTAHISESDATPPMGLLALPLCGTSHVAQQPAAQQQAAQQQPAQQQQQQPPAAASAGSAPVATKLAASTGVLGAAGFRAPGLSSRGLRRPAAAALPGGSGAAAPSGEVDEQAAAWLKQQLLQPQPIRRAKRPAAAAAAAAVISNGEGGGAALYLGAATAAAAAGAKRRAKAAAPKDAGRDLETQPAEGDGPPSVTPLPAVAAVNFTAALAAHMAPAAAAPIACGKGRASTRSKRTSVGQAQLSGDPFALPDTPPGAAAAGKLAVQPSAAAAGQQPAALLASSPGEGAIDRGSSSSDDQAGPQTLIARRAAAVRRFKRQHVVESQQVPEDVCLLQPACTMQAHAGKGTAAALAVAEAPDAVDSAAGQQPGQQQHTGTSPAGQQHTGGAGAALPAEQPAKRGRGRPRKSPSPTAASGEGDAAAQRPAAQRPAADAPGSSAARGAATGEGTAPRELRRRSGSKPWKQQMEEKLLQLVTCKRNRRSSVAERAVAPSAAPAGRKQGRGGKRGGAKAAAQQQEEERALPAYAAFPGMGTQAAVSALQAMAGVDGDRLLNGGDDDGAEASEHTAGTGGSPQVSGGSQQQQEEQEEQEELQPQEQPQQHEQPQQPRRLQPLQAGGAAAHTEHSGMAADGTVAASPSSHCHGRSRKSAPPAQQQQPQQPQQIKKRQRQAAAGGSLLWPQAPAPVLPPQKRKACSQQAEPQAAPLQPAVSQEDHAGGHSDGEQAAGPQGQLASSSGRRQPSPQLQQQEGEQQQEQQQQPAQPAPLQQEQAEGAGSELEAPGPSTSQAPAVHIMLSGMHTYERKQVSSLLRRLRVSFSTAAEKPWQLGTTHVVAPELRRSEKALCAMAAGGWLVSERWLPACVAAQRLTDAREHELDTCGSGAISTGAPAHWRLRRAASGQPAFHGLRVLLHGSWKESNTPSRTSCCRMLEAGGAQLLAVKGPFSAAQLQQAHLALVADPPARPDAVGRALLAAGVACCRPQYVVDYLAHPWQPLDPHRLWGSTAGAELATLEAARAQDGQGQPQCSISF